MNNCIAVIKKIFSSFPVSPILLFIVFLGFLVRVSGIRFGLPDLIHPDEARIILDSMSMGQRMSILPEDINYPLFHKYLLLLSYGCYFLLGLLTGFFKDKIDFAVSFFHDPSSIIFLSRAVTSIVGTSTIVVAYLWGKLVVVKSKTLGLIASLFVALEWQLVFESQFALHQNLAGLSSLLAFLGLSLICLNARKKAYIIGGLAFGFAVASHQTAILFIPGIVFLFISDLFQKKPFKKLVFRNWILFWILAICIGTLGNLHWIFQFSRSYRFFLHGAEAGKAGFTSAPYFSYDIPSIIYWFYSELIRRNYFIGLAVFFSVIMAVFKRKRIDILYLIISLTYFVFFYGWTLRWMHLFVGLLPISMVYGAKWLFEVSRKFKISNLVLFLVLLCLILPNAFDIAYAIKLKNMPETRQIARSWIIDNVPSDSVIAVDWPALSVSVPTEYPSMLRNRISQNYFNNEIPDEIRLKFLELQNTEDGYLVVDMIDTKNEPVWPDTMPKEAVDQAKKSISLKDTYSYFNFVPVDTLKEEGVEYIVITSYTYGMALVNDDPRKEFLINNYLKDDTIPFYSNTEVIYPGTQHEFIFYGIERMRNYFLDILDGKIEGVTVIKEFYPEKNIGPVVKIYKVNQH